MKVMTFIGVFNASLAYYKLVSQGGALDAINIQNFFNIYMQMLGLPTQSGVDTKALFDDAQKKYEASLAIVEANLAHAQEQLTDMVDDTHEAADFISDPGGWIEQKQDELKMYTDAQIKSASENDLAREYSRVKRIISYHRGRKKRVSLPKWVGVVLPKIKFYERYLKKLTQELQKRGPRGDIPAEGNIRKRST